MSARSLAAAAVIALLAGCATRDQPVRAPSPVGPAAPTVPERPVATPAAYLARAASYDQLMIRGSAMAVERSRDPRFLRLAGHLAADHHGMAAQLSMAGRRLDLLPRPELLPLHRQWLDELAAASDPAEGFLRLARRVHQNSYAMHARFAVEGASPTLRLVARNAAEAERRHWAELAR